MMVLVSQSFYWTTSLRYFTINSTKKNPIQLEQKSFPINKK